jgi:signal transduction histidine kinase
VLITFSAEAVSLVITDDGQGFDLVAVQKNHIGHLGVMGMQERAESLGGQLAIQSSPGCGTQVALIVPIHSLEGVPPEMVAIVAGGRHISQRHFH